MDCPGPPAMNTTGSGCGWPSAGISASASAIFRPAGASWFSGTSNDAHCASTVFTCPLPSAQGVNTMPP